MPDDEPHTTEPGNDDEIIDRLSAALAAIDPVPETVRLASWAAFGTRDLDGELAVLVGDSAADPSGAGTDELEGEVDVGFEPVRGLGAGASSRILSFAGAGVQIELEVTRHRGRLHLVGQLTGAAPGDCVLELPAAVPYALDVDELGRFMVSRAVRGVFRVRCRSITGTPVHTSWVTT
jgi:hypothetical protein